MMSPLKRCSSDALRDSEARVRALTREVGALREDLRREVKRRERAVAQAQQHEQSHDSMQRELQELNYANRKLAAELDAAHDAARTAAQRDRRALLNLRDGLTKVEQQVAQRSRQGAELLLVLRQRMSSLQGLLLEHPGVTVLGPSMAQQVSSVLGDMGLAASSLQSLLAGGGDTAAHGIMAQAAGSLGASTHTVLGAMQTTVTDVEKEQLRDEVSRLRSQLRALVDKAAGAAGAASLELQSLLRDSQSEAITLRGEVTALSASLQSANQEAQLLRNQVATLQAKLSVHEVAEQQAVMAVGELSAVRAATETQVASLQSSMSDLQQAYEAAIHENGSLKGQVESLTRQLQSCRARLDTLRSSLSEQQADVAQAMQLVAQAAAAKAAGDPPRQGDLWGASARKMAPARPQSAGPQTWSRASVAAPSEPADPTSPWRPRLRPGPHIVSPSHQAPHPQPHAAAVAAAAHHLLRSELHNFLGADHGHHTTQTLHASPTQHRHGVRPAGFSDSSLPDFRPAVTVPTSWLSSHAPRMSPRPAGLTTAEAPASSAAAAAAAAAIAARMKAQQAAAAVAGGQQGMGASGMSAARHTALANLGAQLSAAQHRTAHDHQHDQEAHRHLGAAAPGRRRCTTDTVTTFSSATSSTSTISMPAPAQPHAASQQQSIQNVDQLVRDMQGLDEEIAALEASMHASLTDMRQQEA